MKQNQETLLSLAAAFAMLLAILVSVWVLPAYFESRTYNKLTGAETSWWDALWVELRVQDEPQARVNTPSEKRRRRLS